MPTVRLTKVLHFSAAHHLGRPAGRRRAAAGPCAAGPHGHDYALEVTVRGPVDENGMVMDVEVLEQVMRRAVVDLVDHRDLDGGLAALEGGPSTGEHLADVFHRRLAAVLPPGRLDRVAVVPTEEERFEVEGGP